MICFHMPAQLRRLILVVMQSFGPPFSWGRNLNGASSHVFDILGSVEREDSFRNTDQYLYRLIAD